MFQELPTTYAINAGLLFCRIGPALRLMPLFGGDPMPTVAWLSLSAALTFVLLPLFAAADLPLEGAHLAALAIKEIFIGVVIGTLCRLAFSVLESAGHLARRAMLGAPTSSNGDTPSRIYTLVSITVLLLLGGHHTLIAGLAATLKCAPPHLLPDAIPVGTETTLALFSTAMAVATLAAAPIFAAGLISDLILVSLTRLLSGAIAPATEAVRASVVQLAIIAGFAWVVQLSIGLITSGLDKLAVCAHP